MITAAIGCDMFGLHARIFTAIERTDLVYGAAAFSVFDTKKGASVGQVAALAAI
jgi:hypothetical protein